MEDLTMTDLIMELFQCEEEKSQGRLNATDADFLTDIQAVAQNWTLPFGFPLGPSVNGSRTPGPRCNISGLEMDNLLGNNMFKRIMHDLNVYFTPVIILIGVAGNLLAFLVFTQTHLKRQSASSYLASLAVVDITFLLCLSVVWLSWIKVPIFHRTVWCQGVVYLMYLCTFLSVWYVVSFTIERYIIVWYPLRKDRYCTPKRAKRVVGFLALLGAILYSFSTVTNGIIYFERADPVCTPLPRYYTVTTVATALDSVLTLIVPSILIIVLNCRIIIKIMDYSKHTTDVDMEMSDKKASDSSSRSRSGDKAPPDDKAVGNVLCSSLLQTKHKNGVRTLVYIPHSQASGSLPSAKTAPERNTGQTRSHNKRRYSSHMQHIRIAHGRTRAQHRTARMLIIVSTVFVILNSPSHVFRIHAFFSSSVDDRYVTALRALRWQELFQLLYHLNFSINFFLYSAYGRQFRTGLCILCTRIAHRVNSAKERWRGKAACTRSKRALSAPLRLDA